MFDDRPEGWRIGQTIFNFLAWLAREKGLGTEDVGTRMADPFHISNGDIRAFYEEFLEHTNDQKGREAA